MRFTYDDLISGCTAYVQNEKRDYVYRDAARAIEEHWGSYDAAKDAIFSLLKIWNIAFQNRYPRTYPELLQDCMGKNLAKLTDYSKRNLREIDLEDEQVGNDIRNLIWEFLDALPGGNRRTAKAKSPVAVAKALSLLAPSLFPLWDNDIKEAYGYYYKGWMGMFDYFPFIKDMQKQCHDLVEQYQADYALPDSETAESNLISYCIKASGAGYNKTLLKLMDEYNYSKFTKNWI